MNKLLCAILLALPAAVLADPGTSAPIADKHLVEVDTQIVAHQHKGMPAIPADPTETDAAKKSKAEMTAQLRALKGKAFEQMFADMMAAGHDKEVARITADIAQATNKTLVAMLTKTKPVLERHAATAHALAKPTTTSAGK